MLNYEIDPDRLRPHLPNGTEIDEWNGKVFASMVGFLFLDTRLMGIPFPFHRDFEEVNLRIYVRRKSGHEWRRGVVFVKELVPRWAIARVAQLSHGEKYVAVPMRHQLDLENGEIGANGTVRYEWKFHGDWNHLSVRTAGPATLPSPGSEEEYIAEHYWGYATHRTGKVIEYRVDHPPWKVRQVAESSFACDVGSLYGPEFSDCLRGKPSSAFLAEGSAVTVFRGVPI